MLNQLALSSVMVVITVMVHLIGLNMVMRVLRSHSRFIRKLRITPLTLLLSASLGIFAIHTIEIWLYAALFLGLGAFNDFETALYFSTSTYAAIGYGDLLMPYGWRSPRRHRRRNRHHHVRMVHRVPCLTPREAQPVAA